MKVVARVVAFVCCGMFLSVSAGLAQSQATTGIIRGTVTSASGSPATGATVVLRNTATNIERSTVTNERGIFVAALLPVGVYDVNARMVGAAEVRRQGVVLRLGEIVDLSLTLGAVQLAAIDVSGAPAQQPAGLNTTRLSGEAVDGLPNNGRNFINLTLLTPNVAVVQGPDGDEISVSGQRGIYNNVSVDGADFNNPFFGEQRGGQRPAFTFNLDAVQEMVVVQNGANAEFGRSGGGFINVLTKTGTNRMAGTLHYFGQSDAISARDFGTGVTPDFAQHQFGLTLGGPIVRDRAFFFVAYDQQIFRQVKQTDPNRFPVALRTWMDSAFGGALAGDYGSIRRTNDANALLVKLDWRLSAAHSLSLKYNYANSRQENGTFDVNTWGRSSNAVERDYSNAVNGALVSVLSPSLTNEFRFQFAREDRPRPYGGPSFPGTSGTLFGTSGRPFPDTGADFANGYRWGMPFFIPITAHDTRFQILNNLTIARGNHIFKIGGEINRTVATQTFIGFANGRFIFSSVQGFLNYVGIGPKYVECSNASGAFVGSNNNGSCAGFPGTTITGPLLLYLQLAPVVPGQNVRDVGTQSLGQTDVALFVQDSWKPSANVTLNYGLRWEGQVQPDPITPASSVFYAPFIGQTVGGYAFPSNGNIPNDMSMFQPRVSLVWDTRGDGRQLFRASAGMYSPRSPGLIFAGTRTSNGSIGQNIFAASFFNGFGVTPPTYGPALPAQAGGTPTRPGVTVTDKNFKNPRTLSLSAGIDRELSPGLRASVSYYFAKTTNLNRFIDRNDAVFGTPFANFPGTTANGLGSLTVLESSAKSQYHGFTFALDGRLNRRLMLQANYTLSFDKSDDDNERDPFSFRYARADSLQREYNWADRDQRHRANLFTLWQAPAGIRFNARVSFASKQPTSASCGPRAGNPFAPAAGLAATSPADRICADGHIIQRNTLRKNNDNFTVDVKLSRPFQVGSGAIEPTLEVFNLFNRTNIRNPSAPALLFNFDGTIRSGFGDPRRVQVGARWIF